MGKAKMSTVMSRLGFWAVTLLMPLFLKHCFSAHENVKWARRVQKHRQIVGWTGLLLSMLMPRNEYLTVHYRHIGWSTAKYSIGLVLFSSGDPYTIHTPATPTPNYSHTKTHTKHLTQTHMHCTNTKIYIYILLFPYLHFQSHMQCLQIQGLLILKKKHVFV